MKGIIKAPVEFLGNFGANSGWLYLLIGVLMLAFVSQMLNIESNNTLRLIFLTFPIWGPILSFMLFYNYWIQFVRKQYSLAQGRVTLEIKIPQDIFKSPEAMEQVLIQLHQTASSDNVVQSYWDGKYPPTHSLEIVSRGGDVRFYINVPRKKFKNIAEAQLYAQYPGIEVSELAIDYTAEIPWDPERFAYFSLHFGPKKNQAYPIKTYRDYGLDSMPKEEEKVDPISAMLEALANIGPGEWYWTQIIISAHRKQEFVDGYLRFKGDWVEGCREEIKKIIDNAVKRAGAESTGNVMMLLTESEKDCVKAIEKSIGQNAYNVGIRGMYIAKLDSFNPGEKIGQLITAWRGYDDISRNQISAKWRTDFDYIWWQDPTRKKVTAHKKRELKDYKNRYYENQTGYDVQMVMTTEELATMFHLPGRVAVTPTLERIPSTRSEAPQNLPT